MTPRLFGVIYVLDEPSAGLHPADAEPLMNVLERLKAAGNSLFVVEHDLDVVRRADWVVDLGPGAGGGGGRVLHSGSVADLEHVQGSATSDYLFGRAQPVPRLGRNPAEWLQLRGLNRHNLQDIDVDVPTCVLTAITRVSGSGKSTLVDEIEVFGADVFDRVVRVTSNRSGVRREATWRRTPVCSMRCASSMRRRMRRAPAATRRGGSRSTWRKAAARSARARGL